MRTSDHLCCAGWPCTDVRHEGFVVPGVEINPELISVILVSEAAPSTKGHYYYEPGSPLFAQTTMQAFQDAGFHVSSVDELLDVGVYLTTAVKCSKTGYGLQSRTVQECSHLLEAEINMFRHAHALLLMGDVAIKAINYIARRRGEGRVLPAGSTYRIRGGEYYFRHMRVFPSYLQAGPSYFIEKSKRTMISEDIAAALALVR